MSGKPRSKLGGWLKAVGLSAIVAAYVGTLSWSVLMLLWVEDVPKREVSPLILACVSVLAFFVALPTCSREVQGWWRGQSRMRRGSGWLFAGILLLLGASQMRVDVSTDRVLARLRGGTLSIVVVRRPFWDPGVQVLGFKELQVDPMPVIVSVSGNRGHRTDVHVSLWMIGVLVLWPWWKPTVMWLVGGRVRGHAPLRSWHYRLVLLALLCSGMLYSLSYQTLSLRYGRQSSVAFTTGRILWYHDPLEMERFWPPKWDWGGYVGTPSTPWWVRPRPAPVPRVSVPVWPLPIVCLAWLILAVRPRHRFRRRWENGLCVHCGYDLRGLKERCTECGQAIEPERLAVLAGDGGQPDAEGDGRQIEGTPHCGEGR